MTSPAFPQSQRGFTLLEVLVAFAVLTVTLGVLLNIFPWRCAPPRPSRISKGGAAGGIQARRAERRRYPAPRG
ncbi:prepilin-type N-terminal cleavage/methylation domain-containing protein [Oceanimonas sp. NS1]|nr:prepilin-type N-terminal cleavage/methylation domain-containing protein [Oceanimonas sp. NS1]